MLNDDEQRLTTSTPGSLKRTAAKRNTLTQWVREVIGMPDIQVRMRSRGNNLHILCEGAECPSVNVVVPRLQAALLDQSIEPWLPEGAAPVHRLLVHGRQIGQKEATWSKRIHLVEPGLSATEAPSQVTPPAECNDFSSLPKAAVVPPSQPTTPLQLARKGRPDAIARYLSQSLGHLDIVVRARVKSLAPSPTGSGSSQSADSPAPKRLLVVCESAYSPDPTLLAEPIAQKLRELELQRFRDALICGQVRGESQPEWISRVDLTPPDAMLQEWSRWGDVQAMTRLLNRSLGKQHFKFSALLKEATLHLTCSGDNGVAPEQAEAIAAIAPVLESLAPQGIQAATIYGVTTLDPTTTQPAWVHWLNLPAASQSCLALSTLDLAKQGNLKATTFLLTRLLNPDLDQKLATGGVRVQIRQKEDLLHIMTDALSCPRRDAIAPAIVRCLKPLQINSVAGVRIYGRRAGQQQPLWNYGVDFVSRSRLVPEATPEFAASDAHVDELLAPPGAIVLWSDLPPDDWRASLQHWINETLKQVQRSLISTQIFVPSEVNRGTSALETESSLAIAPTTKQRLGIALLWGTVGLLLVIQSDWLLGRWLQPTVSQESGPTTPASPAAVAPPASTQPRSEPPAVVLNKPKAGDWDSFNASGFTQPGGPVIDPSMPASSPKKQGLPQQKSESDTLPGSPLQAKADQLPNFKVDYPTLNSRQLDRQLAIFERYLEVNGPPDVLVIGSSRALRGIDPAQLNVALADQGYEGVKVFNLGINGATAQVVDWLVRQVLPPDKLPKLILFADGARAFNSGRVDMTFNGIMASEGYRTLVAGNPPIVGQATATTFTPQTATDSATVNNPSAPANPYQALNEGFNKALGGFSVVYNQRDRLKAKLREQLIAWLPHKDLSDGVLASSDSLINASSPPAGATAAPALNSDGEGMIDIAGFLPLSTQFNPVTYFQKYARVPGDYDTDYESFNLRGVQTEALTNLAEFAKARNIPLVVVNLPLTQEYLDPVRKQHEQAFQAHMLNLAPQLGIAFRDLSGALTTQPNYFSDPSHLNRYGAYEVSRRLAQDVMIPWQVTTEKGGR